MAKDKRIWIKLAVGMPDIPKIAVLSDAAFRAYVEMLCYSRDHLTDGFIHQRIATRMWGDVVDELCANDAEKPSLIRVEHGFQIHDYAEHQETRADVDRRRANGAKGGRRKAANRSGTSSDGSSGTTSVTNAKGAVLPSDTSTESRVQSPERLSMVTESISPVVDVRELSTDSETNRVLMEKAERAGFRGAEQVWQFVEHVQLSAGRDVDAATAIMLVGELVKKSPSVVRNKVAYARSAITQSPFEVQQMIDRGVPWEEPKAVIL